MTALKTMAREMSQGLGALVILPKDPSLIVICNSVPEF